VLTAAGAVALTFHSPEQIEADLGPPSLAAGQIPFTGEAAEKQVVQKSLSVGSQTLSVTLVNMGNPHCLIFPQDVLKNTNITLPFHEEDELADLPGELALLAEKIQADSRFPEGVNVSFVCAHTVDSAQAVVWERGAGPTLACGSAAAAILVAGVLEKRLTRRATVTLPGGSLSLDWSSQDNHVRISGPARLVFEGEFVLDHSLIDLPGRLKSLVSGGS
jgi:diaminopimelate epimerase